jgi:TonB family protein
MSDRKKIIIAIVGSLILHVIFILGSSKVMSLWPDVTPPEPKVEDTPLQMTMQDTPPPEEKPQSQERQYLRTNDDQKTDQKPPDSMFQSDKDTAAASEQPAKGEAPLPTQEGKETPDDLGFKDEQYSLADKGQAFSTNPGLQAQPLPQQKEEKKEEPKPVESPSPTPEETPTPTPPPTPTPTPTPTPAPTATPTPAPTATPEMVPSDEEMAMLRPAPTPRPTPPPRREQTNPLRQSAPATAYRQEQRTTRMQGNINNRGRSSIAALGTPQGRFEKAVQDAVGSRWYYYVRERGDLINIGTVQIRFYVRPDGKVEDVKVLRNSSNESLASTSLQSIIEANIPPMPDDLAPTLTGDRMEFTMSFNFTY